MNDLSCISTGILMAAGKTKRIWAETEDSPLVCIESRDDITAGDGAKHDVMTGKAKAANETTCAVFEVLNEAGIRTHFKEKKSDTEFIAEKCEMIPLEVVVRRYATGSYLKRNPIVEKGTRFDNLVGEFFYKDDNLHDPFVDYTDEEEWLLLNAKDLGQEIGRCAVLASKSDMGFMVQVAKQVFEILEELWAKLGCKLWDMKVEFGKNSSGEIVLADVIDNDSWRVTDQDGKQLDKQTYRDGSISMDEIAGRYQLVATLVGRFPKLMTK